MWDAMFQNDILLFTVPALLGMAVFLVKMAMMLIAGVDGDADIEAADVDVDAAEDFDSQSDITDTSAFKLLSIQTVSAFIMGFGWGGLIGRITLEWSMLASAGAGIVFGAALMWLLAILLKIVYDLQGSGNVNIKDAVGREGEVYANIPARDGGRGRVYIVINERGRYFNAVTEGDALPTKSRVRIVRANSDNTVLVTRA